MTTLHFRRPLLMVAAVLAVLSLVAVGTVMAMAFNNAVAPAWVTAIALYGLPLAFLLMLAHVGEGLAARRRTRRSGGG